MKMYTRLDCFLCDAKTFPDPRLKRSSVDNFVVFVQVKLGEVLALILQFDNSHIDDFRPAPTRRQGPSVLEPFCQAPKQEETWLAIIQ